MKLSEKLRKLRKATNRSQQQVADELGIHINTLKRYEDLKNDYLPNAVEIKKIKNYYNVSYEYLLEEDCFNKSDKNINIGKELGLTDKSIDTIKDFKKLERFFDTYDTNLLIDEFNYMLKDSSNFKLLLLDISFIKHYNIIYKHAKQIIALTMNGVYANDSDLAMYIKDLNINEFDSYLLKLSELVDLLLEKYHSSDTNLQNSFDELNTTYINFKNAIKKLDIDEDIDLIKESFQNIFYFANRLASYAMQQSDLYQFRISNISNEFLRKIPYDL